MARRYFLMERTKFFYLIIFSFFLPLFKYMIIQVIQGNAEGLIPHPDFATHWAATRIALDGLGWKIYDHQAFIHSASHLIPNFIPLPHIHPPTYSVLLSPISALPFDAAMFVWSSFSIFLLGIAVNVMAADRIVWLLAMSTPVLVWTIVWGQVGCFIAAIFCFFAVNFDRRHWTAGFCVALLAIKPNLALLFPLAFAVNRNWRLLFTSALFVILFVTLSIMLFGASIWLAFFESGMRGQQSVLSNYTVWGWENQQSLYGVMRFFGASHLIAVSSHAAFALFCAVLVLVIWRSHAASDMKLAVLGSGSVAITPYCHVHDLAFLITSCLLLYRRGEREGFLDWERPIIITASLLPFLVSVGIPGGFVSIVLVFILTLRAARATMR